MGWASVAAEQGELELALPPGTLGGTPSGTAASAGVIRVGGRTVQPTPVFDTYWRFAAERQAIYQARLSGWPGPWTTDPVLLRHRFTNCFRAADRVSQFLIREIAYRGPQSLDEVVFRTLLFKMFNRVSTWRLLEAAIGEIRWERFGLAAYDQVLTAAFAGGTKLYSAAYVVPPPRLGAERKHTNHLRLVELMMTTGLPEHITAAGSLQEIFAALAAYPAMGNFLAYQFAIDLGHSGRSRIKQLFAPVPEPVSAWFPPKWNLNS